MYREEAVTPPGAKEPEWEHGRGTARFDLVARVVCTLTPLGRVSDRAPPPRSWEDIR